MDDNLKKWLPWIAVAAVALIVVAIIAIRSGDSDDVAATTTTAQGTTTEPASTTSVADTTIPSTTIPATTTVPPTTVPPTTLPPTTLPPTTLPPTTLPPTEGLILEVDGVGAIETFVSFGANDEGAIAAVTASLGDYTLDSGWIPSFSGYGTCPGDEVRGVEWGSFVMLFTKAQTAFETVGEPHFFSYYYTEHQPGFATPDMIEIGVTVAELKAAYDGPDFEFGEFEFEPSLGFWVYERDNDAQTLLWGGTTGLTDSDLVTSINGGQGCGE